MRCEPWRARRPRRRSCRPRRSSSGRSPTCSASRSKPRGQYASTVLTLYDADRCPYCARARIALAEKGVEFETFPIDLSDRPAWLYEKNPLGKVPVLEEDAFVLPESVVIMEYLDERYPEPPLLPADPGEPALV